MSSFKIEKVYPGIPVTERAFKYHLQLDPKGEWLIYPISTTVVVVNLKDSSKTYTVNYHTKKVSIAVFSPSGNYVASADVEGHVKIWCHDHEEKLLKYDLRPVSFHIQDLSWTGDGQRIAVCGSGSQTPLLAFSWDTGNRLGEFHSSTNSHFTLDMKKNRPFGLVTADDRGTLRHYTGTPYKQDKSIVVEPHAIYSIRISPDEKTVALCTTDGNVFLYNERTLEALGPLVDSNIKNKTKAHEGGVYGLCWSADSTTLVSSSADKTLKFWDVASKSLKHKAVIGSKVEYQQLGCAWSVALDQVVSISFLGFINFIKPDGTLSERKIEGLQNSVAATCCLPRTGSETTGMVKKLFVGCCTGRICQLNVETSEYQMITDGPGVIPGTHTIVSLSPLSSDEIAACIDPKSLYFFQPSTLKFSKEHIVKLEHAPICSDSFISETSPVLVIGNNTGITVVKDHKIVQEFSLKTAVFAVNISKDGSTLAVGTESKQILIFDLDVSASSPVKTPESPKHKIVTSHQPKLLSFTPDGSLLFAVATNCTIESYSTIDFKSTNAWRSVLGTPATLSWSHDASRFAIMVYSGTLYVFHTTNPNKRQDYVVHRACSARGAFWDSDTCLYTVGSSDVIVKKITI